MKRLLWLIIIVLAIAGALAAMAPAWVADRALRTATHERLHLENAAGTVWNGSGDLVVTTPNAVVLAPGLHWSLAAAPLLGLRAEGTLWQDGVSNATFPARFSYTQLSQTISDAHVRLDAGAVSGLLALGSWRLQGAMEVAVPELVRDAHGARATGSLVWPDARVSPLDGSYTLNLGEVRANCSSSAAAFTCTFANQGGDALVQGSANWSAAEGLRVQGQGRATATLSPQLTALLQQLGQRAPDGSTNFAFSAR